MLEFTPYSRTSASEVAPRSFRNSSVKTEIVEAESINRVLKRLAARESPAAYPTSRSDETENGFSTIVSGSGATPAPVGGVADAGGGWAVTLPAKNIAVSNTRPKARRPSSRSGRLADAE